MRELDRRPTHSIRDVVVVAGLLLLINGLIARSDFGWVNLNPSPWLLLPILIGSRYGIVPGLASGLVAGFLIAVAHAHGAHESVAAFARQHAYFFTSLVLGGFISGECNRLGRDKNRQLARDYSRLTNEKDLLSAELELSRETRQDLQRHLALLNAPLACLDDDLRKLMTGPPIQFKASLLAALHQHTRIASCAFYVRQNSEILCQQAVFLPNKCLGDVLNLAEVPLAAQALDSGTIAMVGDPFQTTQEQPFLVALPWRTNKETGVLLVQDMPLAALEPANLARLELIVHWAFALNRAREDLQGPSKHSPVSTDDFLALLGQALEAEKNHHLPSVVLRVELLNSQEAASPVAESQLLSALPATAVCTRLSGHGSLIVLLPFGGEPEAGLLTQALSSAGPQVRIAHYLVVGPVSLNEFWSLVMLP